MPALTHLRYFPWRVSSTTLNKASWGIWPENQRTNLCLFKALPSTMPTPTRPPQKAFRLLQGNRRKTPFKPEQKCTCNLNGSVQRKHSKSQSRVTVSGLSVFGSANLPLIVSQSHVCPLEQIHSTQVAVSMTGATISQLSSLPNRM